jgi:hypothetical protein
MPLVIEVFNFFSKYMGLVKVAFIKYDIDKHVVFKEHCCILRMLTWPILMFMLKAMLSLKDSVNICSLSPATEGGGIPLMIYN